MALAAQLYGGGRAAERYRVDVDATLRDPSSLPLDVAIDDLSAGGFRVTTPLDLPLGAEVGLGLTGIGTHRARVIWRGEGTYGCEFLMPLKDDDLRTALSAPSAEPIPLPLAATRQPVPVESEQHRSKGLSGRGRVVTIVLCAIAAWIVAIGLGIMAVRILGIL